MAEGDPKIQLQPESKFPWPMVAILVAALMFAVFVYYLPREPKVARGIGSNAEVPAQPFGDMLKVQNVNLVPAPVGGQAYLVGDVINNSGKKIDEVTINLTLRDAQGGVIQRETAQLEAVVPKGKAAEPKTLRESPLAPQAMTAFRIALNSVPSNWDHKVPEITIEHVSFAASQAAEKPEGVNDELRRRANPRLPASDVTSGAEPAKQPQQPASKPPQ